MNLNPHDLHTVFNDDSNRLTVWDAKHKAVFVCEARNRAVGGDGFGRWGRCPRGVFQLGLPIALRHPAFGRWFVPVFDVGENDLMKRNRRRGIGLHGGGSGLKNPFAPRQGWNPTHGCIRLQNVDMSPVATLIMAARAPGGRCYLTVAGK